MSKPRDPLDPNAERMMKMLDQLAAQQKSILEEVSTNPAPGEELTQSILEREWSTPSAKTNGPDRSSSPALRILAPLLAAAAILVAVMFWWPSEPDLPTEPGPTNLQGTPPDQVQSFLLEPTSTFHHIRWTDPNHGNWTFELIIKEPDSDKELFRATLEGTSKQFSPQETRAWPDQIDITIKSTSSAGLTETIQSSLSRSSR